MILSNIPYWRLSGFYFFYFASLAIVIPFWGLYLKDQGFNALAIGELMAIFMGTKIIAPNTWGLLVTYNIVTPRKLVQLVLLLAWLAFLGIFWAHNFWQLALIMGMFSFFWNAALPQFETITLNYLRHQIRHYSKIRLWGSVGFIITVTSVGQALEYFGTWIIPIILLIIYIGLWLTSLLIAEPVIDPQLECSTGYPVNCIERVALLGACLMMQISHGAYYAFYSLYLTQYGYTKAVIGTLWSLGVIIEVGLFLIMHIILERYGTRRVLISSLILAVLRWSLIGAFPEQWPILIIAQCLHAATFGAFHAAAIHLLHNYFPGKTQSLGQALYSGLSFGIGGAVGSLISGHLWDHAGATVTFGVAAVAAAIGAIIAWMWVDPQHKY